MTHDNESENKPQPASTGKQLVLYADGGISPQRAGAGVVVQDAHGRVVLVANRTLQRMTNNEAEYYGLLLAFETARRLQAYHIEIRLDSEVVVYQMIGKFAVRSAALKVLHHKACALARHFAQVNYIHIPRDQNLIADALAGEAVAGRRWRSQGVD